MRKTTSFTLLVLGIFVVAPATEGAEEGWRCVNPSAGQATLCSWMWDVHSNGSLFVAVGERGKLMTSADGLSWEDRYSGTDEHLLGVTSNGSLWVVVGDGGTVLTSVNGLSWSIRNSGSPTRFADVTWAGGLGMFVAVGGEILSSARITTSTNGINWASRTPASGTDIRGVACDGLRCVAVGASGDIQTSPNAVNWTLIPPQAYAVNINSVTTNGSLFVAAAQGSSYGGPFLLTSPTGETWTFQETGSKNLKDVIWSGTQFVAVGSLGTAYTSPDGTTWTRRWPPTSRELYGVAFDGATYVAVGNVALMSSANGSTWTDRLSGNIPYLNMALNAVAWTGWQFIAVGHDGTLVTSQDGLSWVEKSDVSGRDLFGLALGAGNQFNYAACAESGRVYTSDDLETWDERTTESSQDLLAIASSGYRFVAVGSNGTIQTSQLGDVWTTATSPTTNKLNGIVWTGSQFVAVGYSGTVLTSPDGTVWSEQVSGTSLELHDIVWDGFRLVVSAQNGRVATSTNGINWVINQVDQELPYWDLKGIHANPAKLVAGGPQGSLLASTEATAAVWSPQDPRVTVSFYDVGGNSRCFVAIGDAGAILTWSPAIMVDGFESGNTSAWSVTVQ